MWGRLTAASWCFNPRLREEGDKHAQLSTTVDAGRSRFNPRLREEGDHGLQWTPGSTRTILFQSAPSRGRRHAAHRSDHDRAKAWFQSAPSRGRRPHGLPSLSVVGPSTSFQSAPSRGRRPGRVHSDVCADVVRRFNPRLREEGDPIMTCCEHTDMTIAVSIRAFARKATTVRRCADSIMVAIPFQSAPSRGRRP